MVADQEFPRRLDEGLSQIGGVVNALIGRVEATLAQCVHEQDGVIFVVVYDNDFEGSFHQGSSDGGGSFNNNQ